MLLYGVTGNTPPFKEVFQVQVLIEQFSLPCSVIGNTPLFERGISGISLRETLREQVLTRQLNLAPVAQMEEALVLETRRCRFKSYQEYYPGVAQFGSASVLGTEGRRYVLADTLR